MNRLVQQLSLNPALQVLHLPHFLIFKPCSAILTWELKLQPQRSHQLPQVLQRKLFLNHMLKVATEQ
jgi:hypothetical protein